MARKDATKAQSHGLNDVIGIILGAAALLLLVALLSYDPHDSASNFNPPNNPPHNLGGPLGAWVALWLFRIFGIGAFMIPVLLAMFRLGYLFRFLSYLQRRWVWGLVLLLCCMGLASMFEASAGDWLVMPNTFAEALTPRVSAALSASSSTRCLAVTSARSAPPSCSAAAYLISLIYLTNFKLGQWCRQWAVVRFAASRRPNRQRNRSRTPRPGFGKAGPQIARPIGQIRQGWRGQRRRTERSGRRHAARARADRARLERPANQAGDRARKTPAEPAQRTRSARGRHGHSSQGSGRRHHGGYFGQTGRPAAAAARAEPPSRKPAQRAPAGNVEPNPSRPPAPPSCPNPSPPRANPNPSPSPPRPRLAITHCRR